MGPYRGSNFWILPGVWEEQLSLLGSLEVIEIGGEKFFRLSFVQVTVTNK